MAGAADGGAGRRAAEFDRLGGEAADDRGADRCALEDLLEATCAEDGTDRRTAAEDVLLAALDGGVDHCAADEDIQSVAGTPGFSIFGSLLQSFVFMFPSNWLNG